MEAVEPTCVLNQRPFPRHWKCQKERIDPRIVEAFANVAPDGENNSLLSVRDGRELPRSLSPRQDARPGHRWFYYSRERLDRRRILSR